MAKTKLKKESSTTAKIKELTGKRPEKISEQELAQLQASIKTIESLTGEIGGLETRKYSLLKGMEQIHTRIETLRVQLEKEYGTDNINIQDGTITYPETTKQENGEADKKD